MLSVEIKDKGVKDLLERIRKRTQNLKPAMSLIGEIVHGSIQRNFEEGGRPQAWAPLAPSTIERRKRINRWPGRILVISGTAGGLMGGISYRSFDDRVELAANAPHATTHHFGAEKGSFGTVEAQVKTHVRRITQAFGKSIAPRNVTVKAHTRKATLPWGNIPARPFMLVQDEDWDEIRESLAEFLLGVK
jgi:phage gpG-like protein